MGFTLKLSFTGVCTYIPNSDAGKVRMCVVLPDGRSEKIAAGQAIDKTDLKRHIGFITFPLRNLSGVTNSSDAMGVWYLDRHRIILKTIPGPEINPYVPDLQGVADLNAIAKGFSGAAPNCLSAGNPNERSGDPQVLAQVLIDRGYWSIADVWSNKWIFPGTLSGSSIECNLASVVTLVLENLDSASILATPFIIDADAGGSPQVEWSFTANEQETVEVTIANLCDENPLRWPTRRDPLSPDEDFKWHYQLLANPTGIKEHLKGLELPVPYLSDTAHAGQGANCPPSKAAAFPFGASLDKFIPPTPAAPPPGTE
ncbi:MAG TPA: hypothetical protein VH988_06840 [Thermoanaerobaculia bacterium]|jgi:hypothetical protein|nr:hypothetical protein [Thermoanaerobaculia bacterium]